MVTDSLQQTSAKAVRTAIVAVIVAVTIWCLAVDSLTVSVLPVVAVLSAVVRIALLAVYLLGELYGDVLRSNS